MSAAQAGAIGIDFGTTNTVVSIIDSHNQAQLATFAFEGEELVAFRSALSFHADPDDPGARVVEAGPWAIDAYMEEPIETRFIQSFKSYAASPQFQETRVIGRRYAFEDLLSAFLLRLRAHAPGTLTRMPPRVIVGRPVEFAGANPDASLALRRYQTAFERLGFSEVLYAYEPVAAAFFFARELADDAVVLVGDFGGGTSDFSIVRFHHEGGGIGATALANAGVGAAGDSFDYRIIEALVSPELGRGSSYRAFDHVLPIPNRYFTAFAKWEQLALLRASPDMRDMRRLRRDALEPEKIARLVEILDGNHGYHLYQSVSRLKEALSVAEHARFRFEAGSVSLDKAVARSDFEGWIAPELAAIERALDQALDRAALRPGEIDRVFLTGGSSFVPAVRRLFAERFGVAKLEGGAELVSIASGLAYIGLQRDLASWTQSAIA
jgi:hypothetical chaperone protein